MKPWLKASLLVLALLGGMAGWAWQWHGASARRKAIAAMKREIARLPAENVRLKDIIATRNESAATQHVREEIERTRREIAGWEKGLKEQAKPRLREIHFTANRDPEKGPVRLEHFRNQGNATPGAAFQTAVWAMTTGADDALAPLFAVSPAGREKLRALLAGMTPVVRARYEPPEKVIGLLFARDILEEEGFEIGKATEPDAAGQVFLSVFRPREGRRNKLEKKYPFVPGPTGWQIPISDQMIESVPRALAQASMFVPPRSRGQ